MHPSFKLWEEEGKNTLQTQIYMSLKAFWWDFRGTWGSKGKLKNKLIRFLCCVKIKINKLTQLYEEKMFNVSTLVYTN